MTNCFALVFKMVVAMDAETKEKWDRGELISEITNDSRSRALFIGINYLNSPDNKLDGCIKDAHKVMEHLVQYWGFEMKEENIRFLSDDQHDPRCLPTGENILDSLEWLVADAQPGDSLFLHYSGHGGAIPDDDGDERCGYDQAILSCDNEVIADDHMNEILVRHMKIGVRLTCFFDCCYSGSILDLPYAYTPKGDCLETRDIMLASRDVSRSFMGVITTSRNEPLAKRAIARLQKSVEIRGGLGDVFCFSGCEELQVAADNTHALSGPQGALTGALLPILEQKGKNITYQEIIATLTGNLKNMKFQQIPQLTTSRFINITQARFAI